MPGSNFFRPDSFWHLVRFFGAVALAVFLMIELIALTPFSRILFGIWMGAGTEVVRCAQAASAIMGLWILPILARNLCYGLAMIHRRTVLITNATIVRLAALGVFLCDDFGHVLHSPAGMDSGRTNGIILGVESVHYTRR